MSCTCTWRRERQWHGLLLRWWTLPFLLLIANSSCFGLQITNLTKVESHSSSSKRVCLRLSSILFKSCTQTSNQSVKAPPSLPKRTWTWCWRIWVPIKGADRCVHFGLPKLIQVPTHTTVITEKKNRKKGYIHYKQRPHVQWKENNLGMTRWRTLSSLGNLLCYLVRARLIHRIDTCVLHQKKKRKRKKRCMVCKTN